MEISDSSTEYTESHSLQGRASTMSRSLSRRWYSPVTVESAARHQERWYETRSLQPQSFACIRYPPEHISRFSFVSLDCWVHLCSGQGAIIRYIVSLPGLGSGWMMVDGCRGRLDWISFLSYLSRARGLFSFCCMDASSYDATK